MKFCSENAKDIQKYFQGAYIKFPGLQGVFGDGKSAADAGEIIHTVEHVTNDVIKGKRLEGKESVPYEFFLYSEQDQPAPEIEFILPKKSYFNDSQGQALMLFRIPARQYKRGVCSDNTSIVQLTAEGTFEAYPLTVVTLTEYVGKQAYHKFAPPVGPSYAVTRRIAVAKCGHIFIDRTKVGTIDYAANTIKLGRELFEPEIRKAMRQHGQAFNIVVQEAPAKKVKKTLSEKWGVGDDGELVNLMEVE